jgi:hypothetical protein
MLKNTKEFFKIFQINDIQEFWILQENHTTFQSSEDFQKLQNISKIKKNTSECFVFHYIL